MLHLSSPRHLAAAAALLPPVSDRVAQHGGVLKTRKLSTAALPWFTQMTCGGVFRVDPAHPNGMRGAADLVKATAITVDVDLKCFPPMLKRHGLDALPDSKSDEAKAYKGSIYAMTQEEVEAYMAETGFVAAAKDGAASIGLPAEPNRVIYSGHGIVLVYWLDDEDGWVDPSNGDGAPKERLRASTMLIHERSEELGLWWWDHEAKDIGTRLFPLHGEHHRAFKPSEPSAKVVRLLSGHDHVEPGWGAAFCVRHPVDAPSPKARKQPKSPKGPRASKAPAGARAAGGETKGWTTSRWSPEWASHELQEGGRGQCPACGGTTSLRMLEAPLHLCFKCRTHFMPVPQQVEPEPEPAHSEDVQIEYDARGYSVFPSDVPEVVVIKTGTGSGKTHFMAQQASAWLDRNGAPECEVHMQDRFTVLGLAPTKSLAGQAAARWGIPYSGANDSRRFEHGSATTCFAALTSFAENAVPEDLNRCLVIIDELEPQCGQLVGMLEGARAANSYSKLAYVLAHAGRVIIGDAHAGACTKQTLQHANDYRSFKGKPPRSAVTWSSEHRRYTIRCVAKMEEEGPSSYTRHLELIASEIHEGHRLAIFCASRYQAMGLHDALSGAFPGKRGRCVVGGKGYEEEQDLSQTSLTADWLIYTNAMSTGVSYDVPGHYSGTHVLIENGDQYLTGPMIEQAIHRVRKPITPLITISGRWTDSREDSWLADADLVLERLRVSDAKHRELSKRIAKIEQSASRRGSIDKERLAKIQAVSVASDVRNGLGFVLSWLDARHDVEMFVVPDSVPSGMGSLVREATKAIKSAETAATAAATPLRAEAYFKVMSRGHRNEEERIRANKTAAKRKYGQAYEELGEVDLFNVTKKHLFNDLPVKVGIAAGVKAALLDPAEGFKQVLVSDEVADKNVSPVVSKRSAAKVGAVWRAMREIMDSHPPDTEVWEISELLAERILSKIKPNIKGYHGLNMAWNPNPRKAVQGLLAIAGLTVRARRGTRGAPSVYRLEKRDVEQIFSLSEEEYWRIMSATYQEDASFF